MKIYRKNAGLDSGASILCERAQSKRTWKFHKSNFAWTCTEKMPDLDSGASNLCERAQSKRTWTFHKSNFKWKCTEKMPDLDSGGKHFVRGCAVETHMDI